MTDAPYTGPRMEARRGSGISVVEVPREVEVDEKARVYGSRWVEVETADGGTKWEELPLTWDDLFDPQEGDHVPHGEEHHTVIHETEDKLRSLFQTRGHDDAKVLDDMKMFWADPEVPRISPDVAVVLAVKDPERLRDSFNEEREGTRPAFVLEVTSKATAHFDRKDKPEVYRRAKVRECFVLDRLKSPWRLMAYRLDATERRYLKVVPDDRGCYLAETIGVLFSIAEAGKDLVLEDAVTGEVLLKPLEARRTAERRADQEVEARRAAERRADQEVEARRAAERRATEEAEGRRKEVKTREAAEAKVLELLAKIERLESDTS